MNPNHLILNGFDRCGSSAISRLMASHPHIELIQQPFNSGSIRHKMYKVMSDELASVEDVHFFAELEKGNFWRDYITSQWFDDHSTVHDFMPGQLHVLKTTLNHLTIRWIRERFPGIEFWGIWRDPLDILASLVRNQFYAKWYLDALPQLAITLKESREYPPQFADHLKGIGDSEARALAFLIATRSYFFFKYLEPEKLINYEVFKIDPDAELDKISRYFGLVKHSFNPESDKDYNIVGLQYEKRKTYRHLVHKDDSDFVGEVFDPLFALMNQRFGFGPWWNPERPDYGFQS